MLLAVDSVSRSYQRRTATAVLRCVSLEVRAGEMVAVYGQRSAGKTTLLKVAAGLEPPDSGDVRLNGRSLLSLSSRDMARVRREEIAWIGRSGPHSPEMPVETYVAMSLYRRLGIVQAHRQAATALARVGAQDCADARWAELSDAARTLVAIAHGLAPEPRLLVVDDPNVGLGIVERERVGGLLREAAEEGGAGVLLAVPDMPSVIHAHRTHALSRGRLVRAAAPVSEPERGRVIAFPSSHRSA